MTFALPVAGEVREGRVGVSSRRQRRTGAINVLAYAERRFRRLAPALLVLLVALVVVVPVVAPDDAHRVRGDVVSSLMGVIKWHLIADQASYFQRLGRPSFVRHLWSVAVEIQFYVLCPFLVAWLARRRRRLAIGALAAGVGLSAGAMAILFNSSDPYRAYYGTDTRIGALLAGALLAVAMARARPRDRLRSGSIRFGPTVGPLALVALVALFFLADDRGQLAYPGAFLATQALTAALIAAALRRGPLSALLDRRELRWLGLRSYGIYFCTGRRSSSYASVPVPQSDSFFVWLGTNTDDERDELGTADPCIDEVRAVLADTGFPADMLDGLQTTAQSQETVDREYDGSWFYPFR